VEKKLIFGKLTCGKPKNFLIDSRLSFLARFESTGLWGFFFSNHLLDYTKDLYHIFLNILILITRIIKYCET